MYGVNYILKTIAREALQQQNLHKYHQQAKYHVNLILCPLVFHKGNLTQRNLNYRW